MRYLRFIFVGLFLLYASPIFASIQINEIAWMGYQGDANNEWIELYNSGSASVNLDGWLLESSDGSPSINLTVLPEQSGPIIVDPGGFVLLERTDDSSVPGVSADKIYTGALSNDGEDLVLKNPEGSVEDSVSFSDGWVAGSTSSGDTLSLVGGSWVDGTPTPKASNQSSSNSDSDTSDSDTSSNDEDEEETASSEKAGTETTPKYKSRKLSIQASDYAYVGAPIDITSYIRDFDGDEMRRGLYAWNMGDGTYFYKNGKTEFTHTYQYSGDYVITLTYNRSNFGKDPEELDPYLYDEHVVHVSDVSIEIEHVFDGGSVVLKNISNKSIDLGGWKLSNNDVDFIVPRHTIIQPDSKITLSKHVTGFTHNPVFVFSPSGSFVDGFDESLRVNTSITETYQVLNALEKQENSEGLAYSLDEDTITAIENSFIDINGKSLETSAQKSSTEKHSQGIYIALFIFVLIISGFVLWYLMNDKKKNLVIEGYEIVEE